MNTELLRDYKEWLKRSPGEIIQAVIDAGGWKKVFPDGLDLWAHKVRNYFNHEPQFLTRLNSAVSTALIARLHLKFKKVETDKKALVARFGGLSGDVYKDNYGRIWYQMSPGGTIYHFKKKVKNATAEAIEQTLKGQALTPVFKLISPDGTGGSQETIIDNPQTGVGRIMPATSLVGITIVARAGKTEIGDVGVMETVMGRVNKNYSFRGSYNYAETVVEGINAHEKYDVKTHEKNTDYVNLPGEGCFNPLSGRSFPKDLPTDEKW